jgi:hypothetical protein
LNVLYPAGAKYIQAYNDPTPIERGLPDSWAVWNHRTERYDLFSAALPAFVDYYSLAGANIAADATPVVCYHLSVDDWRLYQFKAQTAAYAVPAELDPILWNAVEPDQRVDRRITRQSWLEDDLEIGDQIQSGDYAGMYVGEIIVPGGKYSSVEGGFRSAFTSGGTGEDAIRNITGYMDYFLGLMGCSRIQLTAHATPGARLWADARFNAARVVPTAADNRVKTIAECIWRRVA